MKNKSVPGYKRVFAWMIAVFAMVIPWISYLRIWKLTDAQADVFENYSGYVFDFFLYYREVLVVLAAIVMACIMIGENIFPDTVLTQTPVRDRQNRKIWICFSVYTAAVLLSFLFSKNKGLALSGSPSEGEGVFVLIGYGILFFGAMNYFCYEETMRIFEMAGFKTKEIIIKEQHNCKATGYWKTNSVKYNFLLIAHEYLFVFHK